MFRSRTTEQPRPYRILWVVASAAVVAVLLLLMGALLPSFVIVQAQPGASTVEVVANGAQRRVGFGLLRNIALLDLAGDGVWQLCRICSAVALLVGTICVSVIGLLVVARREQQQAQRHVLWQTVSLLAAGNAVLGVPVYILLEARPCTDFPLQQSCHFGLAAFVWGIATGLWVLIALLTQVFGPPPPVLWGKVWGKDHDDVPRPRGMRRWVRLESDHESTASGWGPDEEEGLMTGTVPISADEKPPVAQEPLPNDSEVRDKTALLIDVEDQPETVFERSGPAVIYQDLEQEAESVFTGPQEESVVTGPLEESVVTGPVPKDSKQVETAEDPPGSCYSPDQLGQMPSLMDRESELSSAAPSSCQPAALLDADLGSLEPSSVEEITGDESILDKRSVSLLSTEDLLKLPSETPSVADDQPLLVGTAEIAAPQPEEAPRASTIAVAVKKVMPLPVVDLRRSIFPGRRRKKRKPRGYLLMDDSNLESSLPISPPLEIVTMTMINDAGLDLGDDDPLEEEFEDIWDEMDRMVSPPSKYSEQRRAKPAVVETAEPKKEVPKSPRRSRRRKRRRSKRHGSPNSLSSSSGSLLSYTIPEESESDLDDSDEEEDDQSSGPDTFNPYGSPPVEPLPLTKSRSAPNLALFDQMNKAPGRVAEEVQMTGINDTKKRAEVFSTSDSVTRGSSRVKEDGETSPCSVTDFGRHQAHTVVSLPDSPPAKRLPLFRCEREQREGIHSVSGVYSDGSSDGGRLDLHSLPSFRCIQSHNARVARIRRLQQSGGSPPTTHTSPIRCIGKYPSVAVCVSPDDSEKHEEADPQATYYSGGKRPPRPPPLNTSAHSRSTGDHTSVSGATLDELDAELAMLLRPEGLVEGPDEGML